MTSLKSLATCLPVAFALLAIMASLIPHPVYGMVCMVLLLLVAAATPFTCQWFTGTGFLLADSTGSMWSLKQEGTLFTLNVPAWYVVGLHGLQFPYVLMPAGITFLLMVGIAIGQSDVPRSKS